MTTPTQAQIEAAAGALENRFPGTGSWLVAAEAALAAAAQVEDDPKGEWVVSSEAVLGEAMPGDKIALEAIEMLKAMRTEIERLRGIVGPLQDLLRLRDADIERLRNAIDVIQNLLKLQQSEWAKDRERNAELVAVLERIVQLGISQESIEIARTALAKVKEGK